MIFAYCPSDNGSGLSTQWRVRIYYTPYEVNVYDIMPNFVDVTVRWWHNNYIGVKTDTGDWTTLFRVLCLEILSIPPQRNYNKILYYILLYNILECLFHGLVSGVGHRPRARNIIRDITIKIIDIHN